MLITILTLFPEMFIGPFDYSIVKRAQGKGKVTIQTINIRDYANDAYKSVDDRPYGGGVGMIMRVDVIDRALQQTINNKQKTTTKIVLLDPRGTTFTQAKARTLAKLDHLVLICGHYEGIDERVKSLVDESLSIGDYVLTGGELPAMVMTDAIVRLLPGVLKEGVTQSESYSFEIRNSKFEIPMLEYPQYTRPEVYNGMKVPEVLLSGNHKKIEQWKKDHATAKKGRVYRP
ncbi:MAG: tRNA (guanosine(37)-N1)-methyltransferase TrmD [Candidatus Gottesmanbacteria bacterium]|nr:tRNA (guanosine(37)-N1)-methyltransferase TrmD [Candidatus Gottesmanbacteria bacterium]